MTDTTIAVIGAGYAGIVAANRVQASLTPEERGRVSVAIVNPTGDFVERVRLHELAAGVRDSVTIPLADMLHPDVDVVIGRVVAIDADARRLAIATDDGMAAREYTTLVYAVGEHPRDRGTLDHGHSQPGQGAGDAAASAGPEP